MKYQTLGRRYIVYFSTISLLSLSSMCGNDEGTFFLEEADGIVFEFIKRLEPVAATSRNMN